MAKPTLGEVRLYRLANCNPASDTVCHKCQIKRPRIYYSEKHGHAMMTCGNCQEFAILLPADELLDLIPDIVMDRGRYAGYTINMIKQIDKDYLEWLTYRSDLPIRQLLLACDFAF